MKSKLVLSLLIFLELIGLVWATKPPPQKLPRKVAILPFVNHSSKPEAANILRQMFYNFFSSLPYLDVEPFEVDEILKRHGLYEKVASGKITDAPRLCSLLGVDAVIFGEVTTFGKFYLLIYSEVRAGLKARMVDQAGKVIWQDQEVSRLRKGGIGLNPLGIATSAVRALVNLRDVSKMRVSADLCLKMVNTIPKPKRVTPPGPEIKVFVHNGAWKLLQPGDTLKVVLVGAPNNQGTWDILPAVKGLPLEERRPGIYIGAYTVPPGLRVSYGKLVAHLCSREGGESLWYDVLGPVSLGKPTLIPEKITGPIRLSPEKSPYIIQGISVIMPQGELTVPGGTTIWVQGLGLVVRGKFLVEGHPKALVRFLAYGSKKWKGIFIQTPYRVILNHCEISGAEHALVARNAILDLSGVRLTGNVIGIEAERSELSIVDSVIEHSEGMGLKIRKASFKLLRSSVVNNQRGGILLEDVRALLEKNNIFQNGPWNLKVISGPEEVTARFNWWGAFKGEGPRVLGGVKISPASSPYNR